MVSQDNLFSLPLIYGRAMYNVGWLACCKMPVATFWLLVIIAELEANASASLKMHLILTDKNGLETHYEQGKF